MTVLIEEIESTCTASCLSASFSALLSVLESFFIVGEYETLTICTPSLFSSELQLELLSLLNSLRACHGLLPGSGPGLGTSPSPSPGHDSVCALASSSSCGSGLALDWKEEYRQQGFELAVRLVALSGLDTMRPWIELIGRGMYEFYFRELFLHFFKSRQDLLQHSPYLFYAVLHWLPHLRPESETGLLETAETRSSSGRAFPRQHRQHQIAAVYLECARAAWRPEWKRFVLTSLLETIRCQSLSAGFSHHSYEQLGHFFIEEGNWMTEPQQPSAAHHSELLSLLFSYVLTVGSRDLSSAFLYHLLRQMTLAAKPFSAHQALLLFGYLSRLIHDTLQSYAMVYFKHYLALLDSVAVHHDGHAEPRQPAVLPLAIQSLKADWLPYCWPLLSRYVETIRSILAKALTPSSLLRQGSGAPQGDAKEHAWLQDGQAILSLLDEWPQHSARAP